MIFRAFTRIRARVSRSAGDQDGYFGTSLGERMLSRGEWVEVSIISAASRVCGYYVAASRDGSASNRPQQAFAQSGNAMINSKQDQFSSSRRQRLPT